MCTLVILRRPGHRWPLLIAANRDEMADRPWRPPGRHWPDRPTVIAGLDELAGGTWCGLNNDGVVAAVLNRINTLGPAPGLRSRGELPLEALDHAEAHVAAAALADLNPAAYRPFNLFVGDAREAFWVRLREAGDGAGGAVDVLEIPEGYSMLTAYDRNDMHSPRIRRYLPRFRAAAVPDPDRGDWSAWMALLAERDHDSDSGPGGAMNVVTQTGFGTVCSSLIALPAGADEDLDDRDVEIRPIWRFAAWTDAPGDYTNIAA